MVYRNSVCISNYLIRQPDPDPALQIVGLSPELIPFLFT